ncbi:hypothetical protein OEZ86_003571 [Tetradesmus obliquus]|nr:hypothetical protein OEZ86_003571 [Tetradesmus obliquus]
MKQPSSSPTSLGDEDPYDEQQQQLLHQQHNQQLPQQPPQPGHGSQLQLQLLHLHQQVECGDLDSAVDVAQLNARLRSGEFKRWWQDAAPPLVFSFNQQQYGPAGSSIVTSINAFLQAEARRYDGAGLLSGQPQRVSDLLGIRSRQVFLDKATKGGWVLLARQHGVQLADLTPLQPLFERLERPGQGLAQNWPTAQADAAVVQVLQLAAANVVDGVLAARTGSKAVTAAIDTLQAGGIAGFRAPRVRAPPGGPKRDSADSQQLSTPWKDHGPAAAAAAAGSDACPAALAHAPLQEAQPAAAHAVSATRICTSASQ